jgi:hypothetical protein
VDSSKALQIRNPLEDSHWDESLGSTGEATIFHTAAWAGVLHDTYGHRPMYCTTGEPGRLRAVLPIMELRSPLTGTRGVSLPFTDECQPIGFTASEYPHVLRAVLKLGADHGWNYFECRGGRHLAGDAPPSLEFYGHTLQLDSNEERLFSRFDGAVRRAIRKAESNGVTAQVATTIEAVRTYYRLHCQTRRKHGLPPQPWSFFSNVHRHIVSKGKGFVSLADQGGVPVAGAVFFQHGRQALYKFGASIERFLPLRGNNLQMWDAIKWLARHGFEQLDLGRTSKTNEGLRRFKLGWGAVEKTIEYSKYDFRGRRYVREADTDQHWYGWVFRCLPLRVSRLAGVLLYPHIS